MDDAERVRKGYREEGEGRLGSKEWRREGGGSRRPGVGGRHQAWRCDRKSVSRAAVPTAHGLLWRVMNLFLFFFLVIILICSFLLLLLLSLTFLFFFASLFLCSLFHFH